MPRPSLCSFFFFNDTATTEIYTLSLHDALPICRVDTYLVNLRNPQVIGANTGSATIGTDRKSTRLNSSHLVISYAVFCLKKKKKIIQTPYVTPPLSTVESPKSAPHATPYLSRDA